MPPKAKKCGRKTEDGGGEVVAITLDTVTLQLGQGEKDTQNTKYHATVLEAWATIKDHATFQGTDRKNPLTIEQGGLLTPYNLQDMKTALGGQKPTRPPTCAASTSRG